jgi:hypothetical protein
VRWKCPVGLTRRDVGSGCGDLSCSRIHFVRHVSRLGQLSRRPVVDHRIPISERRREERLASEAFPALEQLASLCESHHNAKTRAEQLGENYMHKGCDIFGYPNDPNHPWYRGGAAPYHVVEREMRLCVTAKSDARLPRMGWTGRAPAPNGFR